MTRAREYNCTVTVGYPEIADANKCPKYYNSSITVNGDGDTIANYRKLVPSANDTLAQKGDGLCNIEVVPSGDNNEGVPLGDVAFRIGKTKSLMVEVVD